MGSLFSASGKAGRRFPSRRQIFTGGAAFAVSTAIVRPGVARASTGERRLAFHNLHTGEQLDTVYWQDGAYVDPALEEINHILRDFRTGDVKAIDPTLLDLLDRLQVKLEVNEPFQIISGYRSPKTNATLASASSGVAKGSLHVKGMAIDVRLQSRDIGQIRRAANALAAGGVGYYPKSNFVHLDVGRVRSW